MHFITVLMLFYKYLMQCAKKLGIDFGVIAECMNTTYGNQYEHGMAMLTELLDPRLTSVPWVTVNLVMC